MKQPVKFIKLPGIGWACELANAPGDEITGVQDVHFDPEAKGGPLVKVTFLVDSGTLQTPDN